MANVKGIGKIIGYGIAGVLTIGGASVVITHDDIAQQYKLNTGKELTINENDLIGFDELAKETKESRAIFNEYYNQIDCVNYDYDFYASCPETKASLKALINGVDKTIICYDKIANSDNLEKYDITNCIAGERESRDALKDFYLKMDGYCDDSCQSSMDAAEYNIAMFQAYLNKID